MAKSPFTVMARFYDTLMKGIDYREWVNYAVGLFKQYGYKPRRVLDLACGTGTATLELARRGYEVVGLDASPHMLAVFKSKRGAAKIEVIQADMRRFQLSPPVDACTCFFDSMNYLTEEHELRRCFECVCRALGPRGIFLFDMNTIYGLERVWGTNTMIREMDNVYSVWRSVWDPSRTTSTLYLTLFVENDKCYERVEEVHQERGYPMDVVRTLLSQAGFSRVEVFAHLTTTTFLDISSRVMVVAEKSEDLKKGGGK